MASSMQVNDQSQQRRYERKKDQHDRLWGMNIELKTGHPTGKIEYIAHVASKTWNPKPQFVVPPILPPQRFLKIIDGDPYRIEIDYEGWMAEAEKATDDYKRQLMLEGMRVHGSSFDPDAPPSQEVLSIVGTAPTRPEIVLACRQGNPWLTGKTSRPDPRLQPFLVRFTRFARTDYSGLDYSTEAPKQPAAAK